jgi:hypothetical protein
MVDLAIYVPERGFYLRIYEDADCNLQLVFKKYHSILKAAYRDK